MTKVVAFNCSPHKSGNTNTLLLTVGDELKKEGIDFDIIQVGGSNIRGCQACGMCRINKDKSCALKDDMNAFIKEAENADGIIIGSPVYFSNINSEAKALIDRLGYVSRSNDNFLKGKIGAAVIAQRRAGANFAYAAINYLFGICEMIVPGSSYWNMGVGDVSLDEEGLRTMKCLGKNMSELLKKIK